MLGSCLKSLDQNVSATKLSFSPSFGGKSYSSKRSLTIQASYRYYLHVFTLQLLHELSAKQNSRTEIGISRGRNNLALASEKPQGNLFLSYIGDPSKPNRGNIVSNISPPKLAVMVEGQAEAVLASLLVALFWED